MKIFLIYTLSVMILLLSGCSTTKIPGVYRIDIRQGNDVSQGMLNKLEPGMTKSQVVYVMGTPLLVDTFHPDRWDYVYSFQPGNGEREQRRVTLYFGKDEKLSHIEGDTRTVAKTDLPKVDLKDTNIEVPLVEKKTGLFQGLLNGIGLGSDDDKVNEDAPAKQQKSAPPATDPQDPAGSAKPKAVDGS